MEPQINDGKWHHIAGVYDGSKMYLYVDGNLDASISATGSISTSASNVFIGENADNRGRYFNGSIDEARIWNIAL